MHVDNLLGKLQTKTDFRSRISNGCPNRQLTTSFAATLQKWHWMTTRYQESFTSLIYISIIMIIWRAFKSTVFFVGLVLILMGVLHLHSITGVRLSEGKLSGLINMTRWGDATLETKYISSSDLKTPFDLKTNMMVNSWAIE